MTLLDDRLRTRFEWGLMADVTAPDPGDQDRYPEKQGRAAGIHHPDDIAHYIAAKIIPQILTPTP